MIAASSCVASLALLLPQLTERAPKATVVEGFGTGTNAGAWSWFGDPSNPIEVIETSGGNPGAFLHSTCEGLGCLDTFAPELRTQAGVASVFAGDYRARGVVSLGVDLATFGPPGVTTGGRPLTLMLRDDGGTSGDSVDDVVVYRMGKKNIPSATGQWRRFSFRVPSGSATLPNGWQVLQGSGDGDADWNQVIQGVDQVSWFYGDPQMFFIFQQWELGADNLRIKLDSGAAR